MTVDIVLLIPLPARFHPCYGIWAIGLHDPWRPLGGLRWRILNPSLSDLRAYDPARLAGTIKRKTDENDRQMRSAVQQVDSPPIFGSQVKADPRKWREVDWRSD
ncbi:uncharacterized protein TrAFT101_000571 [Trichoderma asperellum]|uniref:uncharacterized protein n=1 Tax=Trichoderma asperellum TaxID=101201 RepID=UPI00331E0A9B|nr:hypothetical protein TrAFT101_000571 [Trichoderma asperellum]